MFELKAEDVTRLKSLGVSEKVIREMLKRVPPESESAKEKTTQEQSGLEQTTPEPAPESPELESGHPEPKGAEHSHERSGDVNSSTPPVQQPKVMAFHWIHFPVGLSFPVYYSHSPFVPHPANGARACDCRDPCGNCRRNCMDRYYTIVAV